MWLNGKILETEYIVALLAECRADGDTRHYRFRYLIIIVVAAERRWITRLWITGHRESECERTG